MNISFCTHPAKPILLNDESQYQLLPVSPQPAAEPTLPNKRKC